MQQTGEARTGANHSTDKRIGLLTIGQSPRPDLVQTLPVLAPFAQVEAGALDGLQADAIPPAAGAFPLTTRLADGTTVGATVVVDEAFLLSRMQAAVQRLEDADVAAILLMCAGTFRTVTSRVPLVKPFELTVATLRTWGWTRPLVVCPFAAQEAPMRARWRDAGFDAQVITAQVDEVDAIGAAAAARQCVVLDYFGHPPATVAVLRAALSQPVVDIGAFAAAALAAML
ncbi:MAG: AroM family protein [Caldilineaceae bacterium]|nr:AroM family protein [Caldilineaceae bacterium]